MDGVGIVLTHDASIRDEYEYEENVVPLATRSATSISAQLPHTHTGSSYARIAHSAMPMLGYVSPGQCQR